MIQWALVYVLSTGVWDTGFRFTHFSDCVIFGSDTMYEESFGQRELWNSIVKHNPNNSERQLDLMDKFKETHSHLLPPFGEPGSERCVPRKSE